MTTGPIRNDSSGSGEHAGIFFIFLVRPEEKILCVEVESETRFLNYVPCLLYTSPSPRDKRQSRMPSSA